MGGCSCAEPKDQGQVEGGEKPEQLSSPENDIKLASEESAEKKVETEDLGALLHAAIKADEIEEVKRLLDKGVDVEVGDDACWTPLQQAIFKGSMSMMSILLERHAKIEVSAPSSGDADGTILHYAVNNGLAEIAGLLIEKKANLEATRSDGCTPLSLAVQKHSSDMAKLLLENGADKALLNKHLLEVCQRNEWEEVEFALKCGADVNSAGSDGETPLSLALPSGLTNIVTLLIDYSPDKKATVNKKGPDGRLPLMVAAERDDLEMVKLLLQLGADKESKESAAGKAKSPLLVAADKGNYEMGKLLAGPSTALGKQLIEACTKGNWTHAKFFINCGASTKVKSKDGRTPLLIAVEKGQLEVATLLVEKGAEKTVKAKDGRTPFLIAVDKGNLAMAKVLTKKGMSKADKDAIDKKLFQACLQSKLEQVRVLLDLGADVKAVGGDNALTPLRAAAEKGNEKVVEVLAEKGARLETKDMEALGDKFLTAAEQGNVDLCRTFLLAGMSVETRDMQSERPLHRACQKGHIEVARLCLDKGADIEVLGGMNGCSALYFASIRGHSNLAKLLLERGANKEGNDPLGQEQYDKLMSGKNPYGYKPEKPEPKKK